MRFRKRIRLMPGVTLNLSGRGISTTVGVPGLSVNVGPRGTYLNTGLPGTGLYNRQRLDQPARPARRAAPSARAVVASVPKAPAPSYAPVSPLRYEAIASAAPSATTTPGLGALHAVLAECAAVRDALAAHLATARAAHQRAERQRARARTLWVGRFWTHFDERLATAAARLAACEQALDACTVDLTTHPDAPLVDCFEQVRRTFSALQSTTCWDVTGWQLPNPMAPKASPHRPAQRTRVKPTLQNWTLLGPDPVPFLPNANGGQLYLYPAFLAVAADEAHFGLLEWPNLVLDFEVVKYPEPEAPPADAQVIGHTWRHVNRDGSPDRRFRDNPSTPLCAYGLLMLRSPTGLHEAYLWSDAERARAFAEALHAYQQALRTD